MQSVNSTTRVNKSNADNRSHTCYDALIVKFGLSLAVTLLSALCAIAQAPDFLWATSMGQGNETGYAAELGHAIAVDQSGNIYAAGYFNSTNALFGSDQFTTQGDNDVVITKLDATGNVLWTHTGGGIGRDGASSIAVDFNNNVYVTGTFSTNTATFGSFVLTNSTPANSAFFLAKYDQDGNLLWIKSPDKNYSTVANGLTVDSDGNSYLALTVTGTNMIGGTNIIAVGNDALILKFDPSGNLLWSKMGIGTGRETANAIAFASNTIAVTGTFGSLQVQFDGVTLTNSATNGYADIFVAKYDLTGNLLWAQAAGAADAPDGVEAVTMDQNGNVFITGQFNSTNMHFGSISISNAQVNFDIYVAKYDRDGNALWAKKSIGTYVSDRPAGLATDPEGNCYLAGMFEGTNITFDSVILTNATSGFGGQYDAFVTKYDTNGGVLWAQRAGGDNVDEPLALASDRWGQCYITGFFQGTNVLYGSTPLTSQYLDMFVAKLAADHLALIPTQTADGLMLTWPNIPNVIIETTTNLQSSTNWTASTAAVVITNGIATALIPADKPNQQFFRLRRN